MNGRLYFNTRLQPTQIKLGTSASPSSVLQLDYTYGVRVNNVLDVTKNNGNVERQTVSLPGLNAQQSYTYDGLNRLKTMIGSETGGWSQTYSYDRYGNRWVSAGNIPSPQQTPQTQSSFDSLTNRINPSVMTGFGYDPVGNLTSDPQTPANGIVYDGENRQTSYTKTGMGTTSYSYDGDGKRVKKVTGSPAVTTVYVYDVMGRLAAEYNDAQQQPTGGTKYLTADHLGSTRVVTAQNQGVIARYDYLPFGEEIGAGVGGRAVAMGYGAVDTTRQKFTSKERDFESGLDYFGARYYSGAQGRFTSVDPIGTILSRLIDPQRLNRYGYSRNNPLKYFDPDGNDLKLKAGLKKADQDRIISDAVKLYRKQSGRAGLEKLEKSDITYVAGTGKLKSETNLFKGTVADTYGETKPENLKGSKDPKTGAVTFIERQGLVINITLDFQKRDDAQRAAELGQQSAPPSEQQVFNHEIGHSLDKDADLVKEYNETEEEAEGKANAFANNVGREKDTLSKEEAEKRVREIFGLPPKEEKKKK